MRRVMETAYITIGNVNNHREGFMKWSKHAASLALSTKKEKEGNEGSSQRTGAGHIT